MESERLNAKVKCWKKHEFSNYIYNLRRLRSFEIQSLSSFLCDANRPKCYSVRDVTTDLRRSKSIFIFERKDHRVHSRKTVRYSHLLKYRFIYDCESRTCLGAFEVNGIEILLTLELWLQVMDSNEGLFAIPVAQMNIRIRPFLDKNTGSNHSDNKLIPGIRMAHKSGFYSLY
ncbi:hypothetical protein NPIL_418941 [Nephila pilipes]|uniref:Uncharacterized protein n=1 Tax=Nephila pilipes TaxID=299642 RepID=A0A8X6IKN0_NEPPI|nr:hypothetical protein NPIL_418941 [Nephila pilipes]